MTFGGDVHDLRYITFLEQLPPSVHPEWQAITRSVFARALGTASRSRMRTWWRPGTNPARGDG